MLGGSSGPRAPETLRESMRTVDQSADSFATLVKRAVMATRPHHHDVQRAHYRVVFITIVATLGLAALGHDSPARVFAGWGLTAAAILTIVLVYRPVLRPFPGTRRERRDGRGSGAAGEVRPPIFDQLTAMLQGGQRRQRRKR